MQSADIFSNQILIFKQISAWCVVYFYYTFPKKVFFFSKVSIKENKIFQGREGF